MSRGARCTIATSTAILGLRASRPSDHRERLWDRTGEIAADPFQILYQKNHSLCGNRLNLEFDLIQSSPIEPSALFRSSGGELHCGDRATAERALCRPKTNDRSQQSINGTGSGRPVVAKN
jgi:hypothetical protein